MSPQLSWMFTLHQLPKLSTTSLGCQRQHNGPTDVYHSLQKECRSQRHASSWSDHVIGRKLRRRQRVVVSTPPLWTWGAFFLFLIVRHFFLPAGRCRERFSTSALLPSTTLTSWSLVGCCSCFVCAAALKSNWCDFWEIKEPLILSQLITFQDIGG